MTPLRFTLIYWMNDDRWHGKLMEHPDIQADADNLEELQRAIQFNFMQKVMADVPEDYAVRTIMI